MESNNTISRVRTKVGILFGGRSVEHEISVITALQLISALDVVQFEPVPVYIDINGRWYTGSALLERSFYKQIPRSLAQVREVTLLPIPKIGGLIPRRGEFSCGGDVIPIDVFFPAFHGQFGEDGCIQGLLELADFPYTGCGVLASAAAMNKYSTKSILRAHNIPVLPAAVVAKEEMRLGVKYVKEKIHTVSGLENYPLFVKPGNLGSSIGIGVARDEIALINALAKVFKYDTQAIIEPCVTEIYEINVAVCEGLPPIASVVEIPASQTGVLTYEDKYLRGGGKKNAGSSSGMAALARVIDPPELDSSLKEKVRQYAVQAFEILGCAGVVRFDFIVNSATGELYFNELNPFPGSLAFYLWIKSKPPLLYTEFLTKMIESAIARKRQQDGLVKDMGLRALAG